LSEDRFEDLGRRPPDEEASAAERRESIGDQLAERDRTHPEPDQGPPEVPRPGNKYAWVVGIVMLMLVAVALFVRTIPNSGESLFGPTPGKRAPAFALPLAVGSVEGDANLCQRRPCPEGTGRIPACAVKLPDVMNICRLWKGPLVLTFIVDRGADCFPQVDRTERVRTRIPGVTFATVYFSQKDRDEVRQIIRGRRWKQPVGFETGNGDVTARYGVGVCPTTVFMRKGGIVAESTFGNLTEAQLLRKARRLQSET
jgi:hypothetical protein